jgi:hypothetical protein
VDEGPFIERLRRLIGRECSYLGRRCRLIEILADEGVLVLEMHEDVPPIQTDQYGHPAYRGKELVQVPIFGVDRGMASEEVLDLLARLDEGSRHRG